MPQSLTPVTVRGRYFWRGDERFLIKGVVYQLHGRQSQDPLADDRLGELSRDIALFKELGINALFIYTIDNKRSHNAAMKMLAEAGIYVLVGLSTPTTAISRTAPSASYSPKLLEEFFSTIDCMAEFRNTLGVIVGNGVINSTQSTAAAPVVKAAARDVKRYMSAAADATGQRRLPVGYSASTCRLVLKSSFDYLTAGAPEDSIDFFCYNNYNWCGQSTMHISGYNNDLKVFADTRIPVFFSEYGCNLGGPRIFQETTAIYSPAMTRVFSGGFASELFEGPSHFGLVKPAQSLVALGSEALTKKPDFYNLRARLQDCTAAPSTDPAWVGALGTSEAFPPLSRSWLAEPTVPQSAVDWDRACERFGDERWVDVKKQLEEEIMENVMQVVMKMHKPGGGLWKWRREQATN